MVYERRFFTMTALLVTLLLGLPGTVLGLSTEPGKHAAAADEGLVSGVGAPDATAMIKPGKRRGRLLVAHVFIEVGDVTTEGTHISFSVLANGLSMNPSGSHSTMCTLGPAATPPIQELGGPCIVSGTFWLDLDEIPSIFADLFGKKDPIDVSVFADALNLDDPPTFITDPSSRVSIVVQIVKK